ncbi:MAG: hypothetical protein ACKVQC_07780 [Elusimicrobiota bacterium]
MKKLIAAIMMGGMCLHPVIQLQADDASDAAWKKEMERKIEILTQEIEKGKLGDVASEPIYESKFGFSPAASKVYHVNKGVSIGGYGEMIYQNFDSRTDAGLAANKKSELDFLRAIVYVGHKFTDKILFNSEIEFEHGSTAGGANARGEVSVEFAYLDFIANPAFGARAGLVLVPMGITNELHEPTLFHGARRTLTETNIIPTTWRENGVGIFGQAGSFNYRTYIVTGLQASSSTLSGVDGFSSSGIRGGRSKGAKSVAEDFAFVARLDYEGIQGTLMGGSYYNGNAGQDVTRNGNEIDVNVKLWETHVMTEYKGLELKGLYAQSKIDDVADLNSIQNRSTTASVGEKQFGGYAEIAFDLLSLVGSKQYLASFFRYERTDTQQKVPSGFSKNPANSQTIFTYGLSYKPHPNTVLKFDFQDIDNQVGTGIDQFNAGIGYLF